MRYRLLSISGEADVSPLELARRKFHVSLGADCSSFSRARIYLELSPIRCAYPLNSRFAFRFAFALALLCEYPISFLLSLLPFVGEVAVGVEANEVLLHEASDLTDLFGAQLAEPRFRVLGRLLLDAHELDVSSPTLGTDPPRAPAAALDLYLE